MIAAFLETETTLAKGASILFSKIAQNQTGKVILKVRCVRVSIYMDLIRLIFVLKVFWPIGVIPDLKVCIKVNDRLVVFWVEMELLLFKGRGVGVSGSRTKTSQRKKKKKIGEKRSLIQMTENNPACASMVMAKLLTVRRMPLSGAVTMENCKNCW